MKALQKYKNVEDKHMMTYLLHDKNFEIELLNYIRAVSCKKKTMN